jgi:UDP-hydrolysing UDP-N-acetyl-D-glucosamine 2-epimerase
VRTIGVVTVGRSDYGLYKPILRRIADDDGLELLLYATGAHLVPELGNTVAEIEEDGFPIAARVASVDDDDSPQAVVRAMARVTRGFADVFAERVPDLLLVLGDRYEMHAAVTAALPFVVPVAHVHGGESTEAMIDEALRHSITKMSHLHFAATDAYARRIVQMGEEPWRVMVSGAPGLDALLAAEPLSDAELAERHGVTLDGPTLLVTYHPVTLEHERTEQRVAELVAALRASSARLVVTFPNVDTGARTVLRLLEELAAGDERVHLVPNLGTRAYATLLRRADAMVGNSSSGIIEAATFGLPVVNVGDRQRGRIRAANVVDVPDDRSAITAGIEQVLAPSFRASLVGLENPYGDGRAAGRIVERLRRVELGPRLVVKRFHEAACAP